MEVSFLGMNCVRLTGKDIAVICDPYPKSAGLPEIKSANDVTLLSSDQASAAAKGGMVIDGPGEYEVKGAMITGAPAQLHVDEADKPKKGTIYSVTFDGMRVGYLGNVAPDLSDRQVEALGQIDILVLPVGGHGLTLDAQSASKIISQLEPKLVIPTHFDDGATKYEVPQDKLETFLKEVGSSPEPQPKLRVTSKDLPLETTIVVLERQGA